VLIRLADAVAILGPQVEDGEQRAALLEQVAMIEEAGERNVLASRDRRILRDRCARARDRLRDRASGIAGTVSAAQR
jgi:uncharacterized membrane protein